MEAKNQDDIFEQLRGLEKRMPSLRDEICGRFEVLVIFPKQFELYGFLSTLTDNDFVLSNDHNENRECYVVRYRINGSDSFFVLRCVVINSSDIEFSFDLGKLLEDIRKTRENVKLFVFLLGTAGTSSPRHKLGQAFHVTSAIKVDRGSISYENEKLVMKGTKKSFARSKPDLDCTTTICTNHIAHCRSEDLFYDVNEKQIAEIKNKEYAAKSYLMDMETFEFFKTCELNKVDCYQCFRMVSDVFRSNELIDTSDRTRKCVKFNNLRNIFFDYIRASLGHLAMKSNWIELSTARPNYREHHLYLVGRFAAARREALVNLLDPTIAKGILDYAREVGGVESDQLNELVEDLAKQAEPTAHGELAASTPNSVQGP